MEIAKRGTLKGAALNDVAEIHGDFSGELIARTRLVIHRTGRVSGSIRCGKLVESGKPGRSGVRTLSMSRFYRQLPLVDAD